MVFRRLRDDIARIENRQFSAPIALAAGFAVLVSFSFAMITYVARMPFGSPGLRAIADSLLLLSAVIAAWNLTWTITRSYKVNSVPYSIVISLIVLFSPAATFESIAFAWSVRCAFALIIILNFTLNWFALRPVIKLPYLLLICSVAPLCGAAFFIYFNSIAYAYFLTPEAALAGALHQDTYFHSSIASMLAFHGIASKGLDGVTWYNYHFLSHLWIGLTSRWLGVPTFHGYYLLPQIVVFPAQVFFLATSSLIISASIYSSPARF